MKKFLCLLLLLAGCATHPIATRPAAPLAVVDRGITVAQSLSDAANCPVLAVDMYYISPTDEQLDRMLAYVDKRRHRRYLPELFDCDDIAREFRVLATQWAIETYQPTPPAALACASLLVRISDPIDRFGKYGNHVGHAMIAVRRTDGVWFLVEPAKCKRIPLLGPVYEGTLEIEFSEL